MLTLAVAVLATAGAGWLWPSAAEVVAGAGAQDIPPAERTAAPDPAAPDSARHDTLLAHTIAPAQPAPPALAPATLPQIVRHRDPDGDQTPDLADFVNEGDLPTMAEVIRRLHAAGVHTGLGAFSPPGTRPPLIGLAVPEDFPLPAGFVRHYQATDDGQRIEPILMFAPNQPVQGDAGQAIPLPADRVVPPELAPAGMPIRRIELPAPLNGTPRRG